MCVVAIQSKEEKQRYIMKNAVRIIRNNGPINRYKLALLLGIGPRSYPAFHEYLREAFDHVIEYNEETKIWSGINGKDEEES